MKEIEEGTNELKDILCSKFGRIIFVKLKFVIPKAIYTFNGIFIKIPVSFFFVCVFCLFRSAPEAHGGSQARG